MSHSTFVPSLLLQRHYVQLCDFNLIAKVGKYLHMTVMVNFFTYFWHCRALISQILYVQLHLILALASRDKNEIFF